MKAVNIKRAALCVLLGLAAAGVSRVFPLALMLTPALFGFIGVIWGWGCLSAGLAVACAATGLLAGRAGAEAVELIGAIALFLPPSLVISHYLSSGKPYRSAVAACAILFGLALYVGNCVPSLLDGNGPFAYFDEYAEAFGEEILSFARSEGADAETIEYVERIAATAKYLAADAAVMTITSFAMLAGFADVLLARAFAGMAGAQLRPMAPFHLWQLSREFVNGCMVLLVGALLLMMSSIANASAAVTAIQVIVGGPYALMGLCLISFGKKNKARGNAFFTLSVIALALMLPYSIYGLCFIGAFDRIFRMRRRMPPRP